MNWLQPGGFLAMDLLGLSGTYLVAIDVYGAKKNAAGSAHWQLGFKSLPDLGFPDITSDPSERMKWQPLPADLFAAVDKDDGPFVICSNGSLKSGPYEVAGTLGECDAGKHWVLASLLDTARRALIALARLGGQDAPTR